MLTRLLDNCSISSVDGVDVYTGGEWHERMLCSAIHLYMHVYFDEEIVFSITANEARRTHWVNDEVHDQKQCARDQIAHEIKAALQTRLRAFAEYPSLAKHCINDDLSIVDMTAGWWAVFAGALFASFKLVLCALWTAAARSNLPRELAQELTRAYVHAYFE